MTIEQLNSRYGAPGRIVFRPGHCGYPLLGANVLSYRPTGHSDVLYRPSKRDYNRGDSFHGGVPVCFPQFGNRFSKDLPQHGFARVMPFEVKATEYSDEMTEATLVLRSSAATRSLWPHDFELAVKVTVSMKLNIALTVTNADAEPFDFSCGLHPYLMVRDRDGVVVKGLDGVPFHDAESKADGVQTGDLAMTCPKDHIFSLPAAPRHEFAVLDPGLRRAVAVASAGNDRVVVWNPGTQYTLPDFDEDSWRRFVCVEPVTDWPGGRTLEPGGKHVLLAAIQSIMEGSDEAAEA